MSKGVTLTNRIPNGSKLLLNEENVKEANSYYNKEQLHQIHSTNKDIHKNSSNNACQHKHNNCNHKPNHATPNWLRITPFEYILPSFRSESSKSTLEET